jgi:multidrug resistance efflux pump
VIRWLIGAVLVSLGVMFAFGWRYASDRAGSGPGDEPTPAPAADVGGRWVEGTGYAEPRSEVRRLTFKSGGLVARCGPKPGDRVRQGEVIAELDDTAARASADTARRKLDLARARLCDLKAGEHRHLILLCERSVDRLRELARHQRAEAERLERTLGQGAASSTDRNEAVTKAVQAEFALKEKEAELLYLRDKIRPEQVAVAEAEVRLAEAALAEAEQLVADCRLLAPFDGAVLKYLKRGGEGVSPLMPQAEPVALFGDPDRLRVRTEVDERYARLVAAGQPAEVYGRNVGGRVHFGRVVEVERVMGDKTLFTRAAAERRDLHVLQVVVEMGADFVAPVGLRVDVRIREK